MYDMDNEWIRDQHWNGGWSLLELSRVTGRTVPELHEIVEHVVTYISDEEYVNRVAGINPSNQTPSTTTHRNQ